MTIIIKRRHRGDLCHEGLVLHLNCGACYMNIYMCSNSYNGTQDIQLYCRLLKNSKNIKKYTCIMYAFYSSFYVPSFDIRPSLSMDIVFGVLGFWF